MFKTNNQPELFTFETQQSHFDTNKCPDYPLRNECNMMKHKGVYCFMHSDNLKNKQKNNIYNLPEERRKLRPNVKAPM